MPANADLQKRRAAAVAPGVAGKSIHAARALNARDPKKREISADQRAHTSAFVAWLRYGEPAGDVRGYIALVRSKS